MGVNFIEQGHLQYLNNKEILCYFMKLNMKAYEITLSFELPFEMNIWEVFTWYFSSDFFFSEREEE